MLSKLHAAASAGLLCLSLGAQALDCPAGTSPVTLSGRITTINLSETKQVGQICLTLTKADGREAFDDCGALLGKVVTMDETTGTSTLNHTAVFDLLNSFHTAGDTAQVTGVAAVDDDGAPCALNVVEHMTRIKSGSGVFAGAIVDATAEGTVSFCPDKNLNTFRLRGQGCMKNRRR